MTLLKALAWIVAALALLVVGFFVVVSIIDLSFLAQDFAKRASATLEREVEVAGPIRIVPSLRPALKLGGLRVASPDPQAQPDLLTAESIEAQIEILPLLEGEIRIGRIALQGVELALQVDAEGRGNWVFEFMEEEKAPKPETTEPERDEAGELFVALDELTLQDIRFSYTGRPGAEPNVLVFDRVDGTLPEDGSIELRIEGSYAGAPMTTEFRGGNLNDLLANRGPWPLTLNSELAGGRISLDGELAAPLTGAGLEFEIEAESEQPTTLGELARVSLPDTGAFDLRARVRQEGRLYRLDDFALGLGETRLAGFVEVDARGDKPVLTGDFEVSRFDLAPFVQARKAAPAAAQPEETAVPAEETPEQAAGLPEGQGEEPDDGPTVDREQLREISELPLPIEQLSGFEADLNLRVTEVINAPLDLRDMVFSLKNRDGHFAAAPLSFRSDSATLSGSLDLDWDEKKPILALGLSAKGIDFRELEALFFDESHIEGSLGEFSVQLLGDGHTLAELVDRLDLDIRFTDAFLSYGHETDGEPVPFSLEQAIFRLDDSETFEAEADGSLLDTAFSAQLSAQGIYGFLRRQGPLALALSGKGAGADVALEGSIAPTREGEPVALSFSLGGRRVGELAPWLGVSEKVGLPYKFSGKLQAGRESGRLEAFEAAIGVSKIGADIAWQVVDEQPQAQAKIVAPLIAPQELSGLFAAAGAEAPSRAAPEAAAGAKPESIDLDIPILPKGFRLPDLDIDLAVGRIPGDPVDLTDLRLTARIDDGLIRRSPFGFSIGDTRFDGGYAADLRGAVPAASLDLETRDIDLGRLLAQLQIIEGVDARAERIGFKLEGRGVTPNDLLASAAASAEIVAARVVLRDPNSGGSSTIELTQGTLKAGGEEPTELLFDGLFEGVPVRIGLRSATLGQLTSEIDRLPVTLTVETGGARLEIDGSSKLPIGSGDLAFDLALEGQSFDGLDELLRLNLPPWGPYALNGRFAVTAAGYEIDGLDMRVGNSDLGGSFKVDTRAERPRIDIDLRTETLQLDDFRVEEEEVAEAPAEPTPKAEESEGLRRPEMEEAAWDDIRNILRESRRLDLYLTVEVAKVLSGADELGQGRLQAQAVNGRIQLEPLEVSVPGGDVRLTFAVEEVSGDLAAELTARAEAFNYGILARRVDPESDADGTIYTDISFDTKASSLDDLLANANGRFNFAVFPENFETDFIDLWAVNLVTAVMPSVDSEPQSHLNCVIARFDLNDGMMTPEVIYMDTTRITASGKGFVNFKTETIDLVLAPQAKRAQFFSAATPVRVEGKFDDFGAGVSAGDIFGTVIRFVTSAVYVPIVRIFQSSPSPDGEEACREALAWEEPGS